MTMSALVIPTQLATDFQCALCGARRSVDFKDPDSFDEPEPLPNRNEWVRDQALAAANANLEKRARAALALVVCPSCERRNSRAVRRALLRSALPLIGVTPGFFMFGVIATSLLFPLLSRQRVFVPVIVGVMVVLLSTPLIVLRRRRKILDEADTSVRFLPSPPPQKALT